MADIERALSCGFPSESAHKLEARREKCFAGLKDDSSDESSSSSTDDESSATPDSISTDVFLVASSPELGRHLKVCA